MLVYAWLALMRDSLWWDGPAALLWMCIINPICRSVGKVFLAGNAPKKTLINCVNESAVAVGSFFFFVVFSRKGATCLLYSSSHWGPQEYS